jgi:hypothetical protein
MTAKATVGEDGLHILIEINMLDGCRPRLPATTTHARHEQYTHKQRRRGSGKSRFVPSYHSQNQYFRIDPRQSDIPLLLLRFNSEWAWCTIGSPRLHSIPRH